MMYAVAFGAALAILIEGLCCLCRFKFGLRSREVQHRWIGIRLHHGYAAALCVPPFFVLPGSWQPWVIALAVALVASDLIHHLVVLRLATGKFD